MSGTMLRLRTGLVGNQPRADLDMNRPRSAHLPRRRADLAFHASALVLSIWAIAQNLVRISTAGALADESTYAEAAWRYVHHMVGPVATGPVDVNPDNFQHPPLAKLLFGVAQLLAGHQSITADRYVSALCTIATGVVLAVWIGRAGGRWAGLLAGGMYTLLPEAVSTTGRFGRFGMLDPVAGFFMVLSVALAWWWFHNSGRRAWALSAATGVAIGLATASKENGFLGAVGPVLLGLAIGCRHREARLPRLGQAIVALVVCGGTFLACYVPFDDRLARVKFLLVFQGTHSSDGHLIGFAGRVAQYPPWWTNFWFAGHGLGLMLSYALVLAAAAAVVLRHDVLVGWCLAALAAPIEFHSFMAKVVLPFYWVMWLPAFLCLAALGTDELVRNARRISPWTSLGAVLAAAVVLIVVISSASETRLVANLRPEGPQVLTHILKAHGLAGDVIATGVYPDEFSPYTASLQISYEMPPTVSAVAAVVIGQPRCRTLVSTDVKALVTVNTRLGRLRRIYSDRVLTVFAATGPLVRATVPDVARETTGKLADKC